MFMSSAHHSSDVSAADGLESGASSYSFTKLFYALYNVAMNLCRFVLGIFLICGMCMDFLLIPDSSRLGHEYSRIL